MKGVSLSKGKSWFSKKSESESHSDQRRALMLPQEITSLGQDKEIVIMENLPPILAQKILYFSDNAFIDRLKLVSKTLQKLGKKMPTEKQLKDAIASGELRAIVPLINLEEHHKFIGEGDTPVTVTAPPKPGMKTVVIVRDFTPNDLPALAKLKLADFKIDFSPIEKPQAGVHDVPALTAYYDKLLSQAGINL